MTQKLLIGALALGIVAVVGFGVMDAGRIPQEPEAIVPEPTVAPVESTQSEPESSETPETTDDISTPEVVREPVVQAQNSMGDPWQAEGTISLLEDFGFTLTTDDGDYFVELGPPTYWQAQDLTLTQGDMVRVDGYYNGEQVHARVVIADDAELVIRSESGQPMWAGGADNGNGGSDHADGATQVQITADDWLTLTGVIGRVSNGQVTLNVDDGSVLDLQMGRPDFWQSQGITLTVGDPVEVPGFWSGNQFMAGDIRKTETGETIMLRDPNGRQLWAGPGRSGGQVNQGNGNQGNGNQGNGNQSNSSQGNGYRGGR